MNIESDLSINNNRVYSVASFDTRDRSFKGSPMLWTTWMYGNIFLRGNQSYSEKEYNMNYDVLSNQFYIRVGEKIYSMPVSMVEEVEVSTTIDGVSKYKVIVNDEGTTLLYHVMYEDDELQLLSTESAKIGKAYYNTALDAGNVKPSLIRSKALYIYKADRLFELPKKRKKLVEKYANDEVMKDIVAFFKEKRVGLKDFEEVQSALIELNKTK